MHYTSPLLFENWNYQRRKHMQAMKHGHTDIAELLLMGKHQCKVGAFRYESFT